jgi:hypothetical protein
MQFLNFGRVVCNARLKSDFGYVPRYTTAEAFESFLTGRPVDPVLRPGYVRGGEAALSWLLRIRPEPLTALPTTAERAGIAADAREGARHG